MQRVPPIPPSELKGDQKEIYEFFDESTTKNVKDTFKVKREDGAFIGPFNALLYTPPAVSKHFSGLAGAINSVPNVSATARETAILVVGAFYECAYEQYAHRRVALKSGALTEAQLDSIAKLEKPTDANEDLSVAYDVSVGLVQGKGPLKGELYERAAKQFGPAGALAICHLVGFYMHTCMILNFSDAKAPE